MSNASDMIEEDIIPLPLALLRAAAPNWAPIQIAVPEFILFSATVLQTSGKVGNTYELMVTAEGGGTVKCREKNQKLLPAYCPERHMNPDSSFCLGFEAGRDIGSPADASAWWRKLDLFLMCQDTAQRTGTWPPDAQLAHGAAGETQMRAQAIAINLKQEAAFSDSLQGTGWIYRSVRLISDDGSRLINGRAPCLCGHTAKKGRTLLRRQCQHTKDGCLIFLEAKRRLQEEKFWEEIKETKCCGTMDSCKLK